MMRLVPAPTSHRPFRRGRAASIALACALALPSIAHATVWTATSSGLWLDPANWNGGSVPDTSGETAVFSNSLNANATVTLNSNVTLDLLSFNGASKSFTIGGTGASITLSGATPSITMAADVLAPQAFTAATAITTPGTATTISNNSFLDLTLAGNLSIGGPLTISATSLGEIFVASGSGSSISGAGALTIGGTSIVHLGGTSARTTGVTISGGTLQVSSLASICANPASVSTRVSLVQGGRLLVDGPGATVSNENRRIDLGTGGGTLAATATTLFSISNAITGAGSLTVNGPGTVQLSAANSYSGGTSITSGSLWLGTSVAASGNSPLGSSTAPVQIGDPNGVLNAQLRINVTNGQLNRPIVARAGSSLFGGAAVLTYGGGSGTGTIGSTITLDDDLYIGAAGGTIVINGAISGFSGLRVQHFGTGFAGIALLNGHNTYFGQTHIYNDTLRVGSALGALPDFSDFFVYAANTTGAGAPAGKLDLAGFSETIGSLGDGGGAGGVVTLGAGTLTLGFSGSDDRFNGTISGTGGLVKRGFGTQRLGGANSYSGSTSILDGSLVALGNVAPSTNGPFGNSASAVLLGDNADSTPAGLGLGSNGTVFSRAVTVQGSGTDSRSITYELENAPTPATISGTLTLQNDVTFGAHGGTLNVSGTIDGPHDVIVSNSGAGGQGTVALAGAANFSGNVHILSGTLKIQPASTYASTTLTAGTVVNEDKLEFAGGDRHLASLTGFGQTSVTSGSHVYVNQLSTAQVDIGAAATLGTLTLTGTGTTARLEQLNFGGTPATPNGRLDLGNNAVIVDYFIGDIDPTPTLTTLARAGRGTVTAVSGIYNFDGSGIASSFAAGANASAGFNKFAVAVISNADLKALTGTMYTTFGGTPVDETTSLIRVTYAGDANLDGKVDSADYALINAGFAASTAGGGWVTGDFNLDGAVNADDYAVIDFAALMQYAPLGGEGPVAVPEPGVVTLAALLLASARRRSRR